MILLKHNKIKQVFSIGMLIILCILIFSTLFCIPANAYSGKCPLCGSLHPASLKGMDDFFYKAACDVYGGDLFSSDTMGGALTTAEVLQFDVNGTHFGPVWSIAETFYNAIASIGELLCIVYCMIRIIELTTADNFTPEKFVMLMIKMIIGIIVVRNGFDIATVCMELATVAYNALSTAPSSGFNADKCNYQELKDGGLFEVFDQLSLLIPYFAISIAKIFISVICWFRILDIIVRVIFAPVGMSDLMYEGTQGHGFGYAKKMISSALQAAVIMGIVKSYGAILSMFGAGSSWLVSIILAFVVVTVSLKAQSMANDIMGT